MGAVGIVNYVNLNKTKYAANGESELDIVYENWTTKKNHQRTMILQFKQIIDYH